MKRGLALCGLMIANYTLIAMNMRFVAHGNYLGTATTDAAIAFGGFTLLKLIEKSEQWSERIFHMLGGVIGGALGIWLTSPLMK